MSPTLMGLSIATLIVLLLFVASVPARVSNTPQADAAFETRAHGSGLSRDEIAAASR